MITNLHLKNFAAFTELAIDLSPGINIIIGENGTGKTQLLKAMLALSGPEARIEHSGQKLAHKLCRLYQPLGDKVGKLRRVGTRENAVITATFASGQEVSARFTSNAYAEVKVRADTGNARDTAAILIPTKEVLSLVRGLTTVQRDQSTIERIFDDSYLDLALKLIQNDHASTNKNTADHLRSSNIEPNLINLIGGRFLPHKEGFCFQAGQYEEILGKNDWVDKDTNEPIAPQSFKNSEWKFIRATSNIISSTMAAEGFRKIGMLQILLRNGVLPNTTAPLLWDEPESNLNPKLMKDLVLALLTLARNGQQIVLATHDYVLLKWFDLLMDKGKGDHVRFFSLYRDASTKDVKSSKTDDYLQITPNPIDDAFGHLINQEIENDMGELGK